jgi:transposase
MEPIYTQYTPHFIHNVLLQYKKGARGHGFEALANKFNILGGKKLVEYWYKKWDGTLSSLEKHSGGDRRSILTQREEKLFIHDFIEKRSKSEAVNYPEVKVNVEKKTGKQMALRTVRTHGKDLKISCKKRKRVVKSQGKFCIFFAFSALLKFSRFFVL